MSDASPAANPFDQLEPEPFLVWVSQAQDGGPVTYDLNFDDLDRAMVMLQKALFQATDDALMEDDPEDLDDDDDEDEGGVDTL